MVYARHRPIVRHERGTAATCRWCGSGANLEPERAPATAFVEETLPLPRPTAWNPLSAMPLWRTFDTQVRLPGACCQTVEGGKALSFRNTR